MERKLINKKLHYFENCVQILNVLVVLHLTHYVRRYRTNQNTANILRFGITYFVMCLRKIYVFGIADNNVSEQLHLKKHYTSWFEA